MASTESDPITGVWGGAPSGGPGGRAPDPTPGTEPPVWGQGKAP